MYQGHMGEISNRAVWEPTFEFIDDETGETIDLSTADEILFEIRDGKTNNLLVSASLTGGEIELHDDYTFQVHLTDSDLRNVTPGQHRALLSFTMDDKKHDPVLANITILQGVG